MRSSPDLIPVVDAIHRVYLGLDPGRGPGFTAIDEQPRNQVYPAAAVTGRPTRD